MNKRILIVEDQEDNRSILRDLLSTAGYELIEATNGAEGVELAQRERPDLILMDTSSFPSSTGMKRHGGSRDTPN